MKIKSAKILFLMAALLIAVFIGQAFTQDVKAKESLTDFWKIGDEYKYRINILGSDVGYSKGIFLGAVKHEVVGNKYLIQTEAVVGLPNGETTNKTSANAFVQGQGYPVYYTADYFDKGDSTHIQGLLTQDGFTIREKVDTTYVEYNVPVSPSTFVCDRQTIPHWNIAFFNEPDLNRDTIQFSIMIPNQKIRAIMKMVRQPDSKLVIMGKEVLCKVFYSLRTDEYYYVMPDKHVALVEYPRQDLKYELISVKNMPPDTPKK